VSADFVGIWFTSFGVIKSFGREFAIGADAKPDAVIYGCIRSRGPQRQSRRTSLAGSASWQEASRW